VNRQAKIQLVALVFIVGAAMAAVAWVNQTARELVGQAVRHNFSAAGLLSRIQVEGERMRRYEKEMFIYAAQAEARAKYAKEFDGAYTKLIALNNEAAALGHKGFTDEDRAEMAKWLDATAFYANEFRRLTASAEAPSADTAALTLTLNNGIKAGKDRFRVLLDGASAMREKKEQQAMAINDAIDQVFARELLMMMLIGGVIVVGGAAWLLVMRPGAAGSAAHGRLAGGQAA
jgi:hypothetical protein